MGFLDLVRHRHSLRRYDSRPVPREVLDRCCEAARLAPSACNGQPWRFLLADRDPLRSRLGEAAFSGAHRMNRFALDAPVLVVIAGTPPALERPAGGPSSRGCPSPSPTRPSRGSTSSSRRRRRGWAPAGSGGSTPPGWPGPWTCPGRRNPCSSWRRGTPRRTTVPSRPAGSPWRRCAAMGTETRPSRALLFGAYGAIYGIWGLHLPGHPVHRPDPAPLPLRGAPVLPGGAAPLRPGAPPDGGPHPSGLAPGRQGGLSGVPAELRGGHLGLRHRALRGGGPHHRPGAPMLPPHGLGLLRGLPAGAPGGLGAGPGLRGLRPPGGGGSSRVLPGSRGDLPAVDAGGAGLLFSPGCTEAS